MYTQIRLLLKEQADQGLPCIKEQSDQVSSVSSTSIFIMPVSKLRLFKFQVMNVTGVING